jgi:hypothetical protein
MRIQSKNFLLTLTVEHTGHNGMMTISAYGSDFEPLPIQRSLENNIEKIEVSTYLPNTVMLVLSGKTTQNNASVKLLDMSLAGIKINSNILLDLIDYRPIQSDVEPESIRDYLNNAAMNPTPWDQNGCVLFNIFDSNPFAYLLYIGNKINF